VRCDLFVVFEDYIDSGLLSATPKQIKIRSYRGYKCAEKRVALLLGGEKILLAPVAVELSTIVPRLRVCGTPGMSPRVAQSLRYRSFDTLWASDLHYPRTFTVSMPRKPEIRLRHLCSRFSAQ
jgi:hypothetical protein